jgi:hypothetical protein
MAGEANLVFFSRQKSPKCALGGGALEKGENTRSLDLCVPILSMPFVKLNGAVIKWRES